MAQSLWAEGSAHFPCVIRSYYGLKDRFSATLSDEPEIELTLA